jgi:tellurite resistance protein TerA
MMCGMGQTATGDTSYVPTIPLGLAVNGGTAPGTAADRSGTGAAAPVPEVYALLLDASGTASAGTWPVSAARPADPSGAVRHLGANEHGQWLQLDLAAIGPGTDRVLVVASAPAPGTAPEPGSAAATVLEVYTVDGESVLRYEGPGTTAGAVVLGDFHRRSGGWKFRAAGECHAGGYPAVAAAYGAGDGAPTAPAPTSPAPAPPPPASPAAAPAPVPTATAPSAAASPAPVPPVPQSAAHPGPSGHPAPADGATPGDWSFGEVFEPVVFRGHDKDVIDTGDRVPPGPVIVRVEAEGSAYLIVRPLNRANKGGDSLMSGSMDDFRGSAVINAPKGRPLRLEIEYRGPWTVTVEPVASARRLAGELTGRGEEVLLHTGGPADLHLESPSDVYVIVRCYEVGNRSSLPGDQDSVFSRSGPFSVTLPLVQGPLLVAMENARNDWRARLEPLDF